MTFPSTFTRRSFLGASAAAVLSRPLFAEKDAPDPWLRISLQQYSFNRAIRAGQLDPLDYPKFAVAKTGIKALEYFNGFFENKLEDEAYFTELKKRSDDLGVANQLILCRSDLALDSPKAEERRKAAAYLAQWGAVAQKLGCHSIRVDCRSGGEREEVKKQAIDGLRQLCDLLKPLKIDAIVENHGGWSSTGDWVKEVMQEVARDNCGTLPDFGNFRKYDKYQGVKDMLPWARAVCAKVHKIKEDGEAAGTDFRRMLGIMKEGGFKGYLAIEFEGGSDPVAGILGTKKLITRTLAEMP